MQSDRMSTLDPMGCPATLAPVENIRDWHERRLRSKAEAGMRAKLLMGILSFAAFAMNCPAQQNGPAGNIVQGMNLVNPYRGSVVYQDKLIAQLREIIST